MKETFTITEQHLKLLKHMCVGWNDCEFGAPEIDPKRPYGNSDVELDIIEILELSTCDMEDCDVYEEHADVIEIATRIHYEMQTVLQIGLCTLQFKPGTYTKKNEYDSTSWIKLPLQVSPDCSRPYGDDCGYCFDCKTHQEQTKK